MDTLKSRQASTLKWHAYGDVFCVGCKTRLYQIIDPRSQESVCEWIVLPFFFFSFIRDMVQVVPLK